MLLGFSAHPGVTEFGNRASVGVEGLPSLSPPSPPSRKRRCIARSSWLRYSGPRGELPVDVPYSSMFAPSLFSLPPRPGRREPVGRAERAPSRSARLWLNMSILHGADFHERAESHGLAAIKANYRLLGQLRHRRFQEVFPPRPRTSVRVFGCDYVVASKRATLIRTQSVNRFIPSVSGFPSGNMDEGSHRISSDTGFPRDRISLTRDFPRGRRSPRRQRLEACLPDAHRPHRLLSRCSP